MNPISKLKNNKFKSFIKKFNKKTVTKIKITYYRAFKITPIMLGHIVAIYNGKDYFPIFIISDMINHKFGEFSPGKSIIKKYIKDLKSSYKKHGSEN
nr:ribosomal protein S19 [Thonningia sanguinea]WJE89179.1 ribosomal protein S19 [Thonningia sanguinea]